MSTAKKEIQRFIILGDSLSDRGTMQKKPIIGRLLLPSSKSREGSFTNAYTWDDQYAAAIASQYFIKKILNITEADLKAQYSKLSSEERNAIAREIYKIQRLARDSTLDSVQKQVEISIAISEALQQNPVFKQWFQNIFNLDDDESMIIDGQPLVRTYCIGGLTSHDWTSYGGIFAAIKFFFQHPILFFTRLMLSTLDEQRLALLADDAKLSMDPESKTARDIKEKTLIIEWSGANDIFTANRLLADIVEFEGFQPLDAADQEQLTSMQKDLAQTIDQAIQARIKNIETLIATGYRNFSLFNLPDLSLTPRFSGNIAAATASRLFNDKLTAAINKLQTNYSHCSISLFNVNSPLQKIKQEMVADLKKRICDDRLSKPEAEALAEIDKNIANGKIIVPADISYNQDKLLEFRAAKLAEKLMFWDDVHPVSDIHAKLAVAFQNEYDMRYRYITDPAAGAVPCAPSSLRRTTSAPVLSTSASTLRFTIPAKDTTPSTVSPDSAADTESSPSSSPTKPKD